MTTKATETPAQATPKADLGEKLYPETEAPKTEAPVTPVTEAKVEGEAPKDEKKDESQGEKKSEVPAKYELTIPKDSVLDQAHLDAVTSYAKEKGLTNEQAQEILDRDSALLTSRATNQQQQFETQIKEWAKSVETDKELGGDHYKESVHLAKQVAERFGSTQFLEDLKNTGFGNHPELVRFMYRIGKAMDNDTLVRPGAGASAQKKSLAEVFYGSTEN